MLPCIFILYSFPIYYLNKVLKLQVKTIYLYAARMHSPLDFYIIISHEVGTGSWSCLMMQYSDRCMIKITQREQRRAEKEQNTVVLSCCACRGHSRAHFSLSNAWRSWTTERAVTHALLKAEHRKHANTVWLWGVCLTLIP